MPAGHRSSIIPEHIEFRVIRSIFDPPLLWEKLTSFSTGASNITTLEIVRETRGYHLLSINNEILPTRFIESQGVSESPPSSTESLTSHLDTSSFLTALDVMTGLTRFHWSYSSIPIMVLSAFKESCPSTSFNLLASYHHDLIDLSFGNSVACIDFHS